MLKKAWHSLLKGLQPKPPSSYSGRRIPYGFFTNQTGTRLFGIGRTSPDENSTSGWSELPLPAGVVVSYVAPGHDNILIIDTEGIIYSYGITEDLLGHGDHQAVVEQGIDVKNVYPIKFFEGRKIRHAAVGIFHSVAVTEDGKAYTWGNASGGNGKHGYKVPGTSTLPRLVDAIPEEAHARYCCAAGNDTTVSADGGKIYFFGLSPVTCAQLPDGQEAVQMCMHRGRPVILTDHNKLYHLAMDRSGIEPVSLGPLEGKYISRITATDNTIVIQAGVPKWTTETHALYPKEFHDLVKAFLLTRTLDENKEPRHPECKLWEIPIEIIMLIIQYTATSYYGASTGVYECAVPGTYAELTLAKHTIISAAGGYGHQIVVTDEGQVYGFENPWNQAPNNSGPGGTIAYNFPIPMKMAYAGYYMSWVLGGD